MQYNGFEINVLVKGRPINEYYHNLQYYVEGRDGSEFEIELKNNTHRRVEAVLSVDGLSVIDGKDAGPHSAGYVVEANETLRVPGWKLTDEQVAAFTFAGKKGSYAAQTTGSARNTGVIGALVFYDRSPQAAFQMNNWQIQNLLAQQGGAWVNTMNMGYVDPNAITTGGPLPYQGTYTCSIGGAVGSAAPQMRGAARGGGLSKGISSGPERSATRSRRITPGVSTTVDHSSVQPVEQTLGTGFGAATDFATETVAFQRGDLAAMMVLYYDDSRGLRARGIELVRPAKRKVAQQQPQAFPAMNCSPPPGWKG